MQAFRLDTILSKGIKAMRGLKTINPLRFPWLNVPFLWISLQLLIFPPDTNWPVTALPWHFLRFPVIPFTPQNDLDHNQPSSPLSMRLQTAALFFMHLFLRSLDTVVLLVPPLWKMPSFFFYCNRLPVITCSWWSCTSGWAPQSEWVDTNAGPVLLDHMSARRGRCTVPGHI